MPLIFRRIDSNFNHGITRMPCMPGSARIHGQGPVQPWLKIQ